MTETLLRKPELCRGCVGWNWQQGYGYTRNEGTGRLPLMVVAEAPGEHEEEEARPLSPNGASGKVFRRALRELGIPAAALTITNVLRCRPPDNDLRGMPWEREALDHCSRYLFKTAADAAPRVLLALGDVPLRELTEDRPGTVTAMRGFVLPSKWADTPLISTYHPSFIARGQWQLYGTFKHDIATAARFALHGVTPQLERTYELHPRVSDVERFIGVLSRDRTCSISYDVETAHILGEQEPDDWREKRIVQIQFSAQAGTAIVLPLRTAEQRATFGPLAQRILALPNPKWGWNSRLSDDLAIRALGWEIAGELHDLMNAWGHLQPSFWGGKSDIDTDKGVPSRLMGLQSCVSFYCPEVGPWKHLGTPEAIAADPDLLPLYGAYDGDYTKRVGIGIMESLEAQGLMAGYRSHKLDLRPVLDYLGEIGLPVDRTKQTELRQYVTTELQGLQERIQRLVPPDILGLHPPNGYKATSSKMALAATPEIKVKLTELIEHYDAANPPLVIAASKIGYLVQRVFPVLPKVVEDRTEPVKLEHRWCVERLYNPHGSSPNTKSYIRYMGYRMPRALDTGEDTTGKVELAKLADETGDEVLKLTGEWREFAQVANNYSGGYWIPGEDERVHAEFRFGTASAQLVAVRPPVMTYPEHSELAKRVKGVIRAQPGHTLVKVDKRGFHARMTGWLARDPVYYRIADFDVHSFVTAGFLKLRDAPYLMDMADDELRGALDHIKEEHKHTRNYKVKRVVHGVTFGAKVNKIYGLYGPNFDPKPEEVIADVGEARWYDWDPTRQRRETERRGRATAQGLITTLGEQFPRTFIVFPEWVREQIYRVSKCRLVSPFSHHRWFFDFDMEQATAFLPSNCAHCDIQAQLVTLHRSGVLRHFEAVNFTHDALWLHPHDRDVANCIGEVQEVFNTPSTVLVDNPLGPFQCNSDAEVGGDLAHMDAWKG